MSSFLSWIWGGALAGLLLARHAGAAQSCVPRAGESPRERAKAEFGAGVSAYEAKRYRDAIDHLMCANELVPSADLAYNIAVTYDAMDDAASALRWYREYRRQGGADADAEPLREKVAALEAALQARGVQQVTFVSTPPGATLRIDDQPMGLTPFTLELKPGWHRYQLSAAGHASAEATFELRPDRALEVAVELAPAGAAAQGAGAAGAAGGGRAAGAAGAFDAGGAGIDASEQEFDAGVGAWTWVSLGAGTLLIGAALGLELRRAQLDDDLGEVSQARYRERYDEMATYQTTARVLFGLGAAALTAGVVLFVLDANEDAGATAVALAPCAGGGLCLGAGGAF